MIPHVLFESLNICDEFNLFLSRSKNRHHQVKLYNTDVKFGPIGPYTLPRTIPFLGQMQTELRNWPSGAQFVTMNESDDGGLAGPFLDFCTELDDGLLIYRSNR